MSGSGASWAERWKSVCNKIGSQTQITVVNYTRFTLKVNLEVGGVVYQHHYCPANDNFHEESTDQAFGEENWSLVDAAQGERRGGNKAPEQMPSSPNFAVVKFKCGFVFYTITAQPCEPSIVSDEWSTYGELHRVHFVYGGSVVSVRPVLDKPGEFVLFNESADNQKLSHEWESALEKTKSGLDKVYTSAIVPAVDAVTPAVERARASLSRKFTTSSSGANAGPQRAHASGHEFGSGAHDEYARATQGVLNEWTFDEQDDASKDRVEQTYTPIATRESPSESFSSV